MTAHAVQAIAKAIAIRDGDTLELHLADAAGGLRTLCIARELVPVLRDVLQDFAARSEAPGPAATKLPQSFAVGTARFEQLVLVRFEDDPPYGLRVEHAAELGRALVQESREAGQISVPALQ